MHIISKRHVLVVCVIFYVVLISKASILAIQKCGSAYDERQRPSIVHVLSDDIKPEYPDKANRTHTSDSSIWSVSSRSSKKRKASIPERTAFFINGKISSCGRTV
jgi:hypothetical protein